MQTVKLKGGAIVADVPRAPGWSGEVPDGVAGRMREQGMLDEDRAIPGGKAAGGEPVTLPPTSQD